MVGAQMTDAPQTKVQPPGDVQAFDVRTGQAALDVSRHPAGGRSRQRDVGKRLVGVLGQRESLVADQRRRRTGARVLPADQPDQRHVRRSSARQQSVQRHAGVREVRDRRTRLALPDRASRSVGLRSAGGADPRRHHRRRPPRSRPSCRSPSRRSRSSSIARTESRCGRSKSGRCRSPDTPGERTSATQPFPTKPPPFDRQGVTVDDLIDFTPELRAQALQLVKQYRIGPLFTPPSIRGDGPGGTKGTIQLPGSVGGADWQGAAFDPDTRDALRRRRSPVRSSRISSKAIRRAPISTTCPGCARIRRVRRDSRCSSRRTAASPRSI